MPYSTQLGYTFVSDDSESLFTAPVGYVTVLREVDVGQEESGPATLLLYAVIGPGPLTALIGNSGDLSQNEVYQWRGRLVLRTGDQLQATSAGAGFTVVASGYLLSAP